MRQQRWYSGPFLTESVAMKVRGETLRAAPTGMVGLSAVESKTGLTPRQRDPEVRQSLVTPMLTVTRVRQLLAAMGEEVELMFGRHCRRAH